jgi:hypothetical protein
VDVIVAGRQRLQAREASPGPQQVDLDEVRGTAENLASLFQVGFTARGAEDLVRGAQDLDDRHDLPRLDVLDDEPRLADLDRLLDPEEHGGIVLFEDVRALRQVHEVPLSERRRQHIAGVHGQPALHAAPQGGVLEVGVHSGKR